MQTVCDVLRLIEAIMLEPGLTHQPCLTLDSNPYMAYDPLLLRARSQTVGDIRRFIAVLMPDMPHSYRLLTAFPQAQLTDDSATIEAAGLKNAVIMQKLVRSSREAGQKVP